MPGLRDDGFAEVEPHCIPYGLRYKAESSRRSKNSVNIETLPAESKDWRQTVKRRFPQEFTQTAEREIQELEKREWVFEYKFNVLLYVRGDFQSWICTQQHLWLVYFER